MTLEQTNTEALAAAEAGDLVRLKKALGARRSAIAHLKRQPPSPQLAVRFGDALETGRSIARALFLLKQRLGFENARLARFTAGLALGCGVERKPPSLRG
jgi:hypothetical protein